MTFLFLTPWLAWLIVGAAAAVAAAVFAIRPRPRRSVVASLLVWGRVLDEAPERSWWDRVRWIVSLAITVLIAVAIAAALAGPARTDGASRSGRLLIVLDSSWSMRARTPSGATRWELAVQAARALADGSTAREIAVATTGEGVVERPAADLTVVHRALDRLSPSGGEEGGWPGVTDADGVHFFTDGALDRMTPSGVTVHSVFVPASNVAIAAFDVQPSAAVPGRAEVFLAIVNHARQPQAIRVVVSRGTDIIFERTIETGAGETRREAVSVASAGEPRFRAHVDAGDNQLAIDDDATAWLWTAQPLQVAVVGTSGRLPALLAQDASLRVVATDAAGYSRAKADVWVFDGWLPATPPAQPALVIDPPASDWLGPRGAEETQPVWVGGGTHPVLEGVDQVLVQVGHARTVTRPGLEPVARSARNTPLVSIEDSRVGRYVVLGFAIADSNLRSTPAFPILIENAIDWLGRPARDLRRSPGPVLLPAATVQLVAPDGRSVPLARLDGRITATLDTPGLYLVRSAEGQSVLRVTLGHPDLSNLLVSRLAERRAAPSAPRAPRSAWWVYAALAALVLVTLEWVTWQRRITV